MWLLFQIFNSLLYLSCSTANVRDDYMQYAKTHVIHPILLDEVELIDYVERMMDSTPSDVHVFGDMGEVVKKFPFSTVLVSDRDLILAVLEGFSPNLKSDEALHMIQKYVEMFLDYNKGNADPLDNLWLFSLVNYLTSPAADSRFEVMVVVNLIAGKAGAGSVLVRAISAAVKKSTELFTSGETKEAPPRPEDPERPEPCYTTECEVITNEIYAFSEETYLKPILSKFPVTLAAGIKYLRASRDDQLSAKIEYDKARPPDRAIPFEDLERLDLATAPIHSVNIGMEQMQTLLAVMKFEVELTGKIDPDSLSDFTMRLNWIFNSFFFFPISASKDILISQRRIRINPKLSLADKKKLRGFMKELPFRLGIRYFVREGQNGKKLFPTCASD